MSKQSTAFPEKDSNEVKSRKRRNEKGWAKNIAKKRRADGQSYTSSRGKEVEARKTGITCR